MRERAFRRTLVLAVAMLIVRFLLGTTVKLFVKTPSDHPEANPPESFGGVLTSVSWAILHGGWWLTLHSAWGFVLALASVMAVGLALGLSAYAALLYRIPASSTVTV